MPTCMNGAVIYHGRHFNVLMKNYMQVNSNYVCCRLYANDPPMCLVLLQLKIVKFMHNMLGDTGETSIRFTHHVRVIWSHHPKMYTYTFCNKESCKNERV